MGQEAAGGSHGLLRDYSRGWKEGEGFGLRSLPRLGDRPAPQDARVFFQACKSLVPPDPGVGARAGTQLGQGQPTAPSTGRPGAPSTQEPKQGAGLLLGRWLWEQAPSVCLCCPSPARSAHSSEWGNSVLGKNGKAQTSQGEGDQQPHQKFCCSAISEQEIASKSSFSPNLSQPHA